jgi:hypothetical protein
MEKIPDGLAFWPVLPVGRVLFPGQTARYNIGKRTSVATIKAALEKLGIAYGKLPDAARRNASALVGVVLVRTKGVNDETPKLHEVATAARLLEVHSAQAGGGNGEKKAGTTAVTAVFTVVLQGICRLRLGRPIHLEPVLRVEGTRLYDPDIEPSAAAAYGLSLAQVTQELLKQQQVAGQGVNDSSIARIPSLLERLAALSGGGVSTIRTI